MEIALYISIGLNVALLLGCFRLSDRLEKACEVIRKLLNMDE
jgi:hypothetical protein